MVRDDLVVLARNDAAIHSLALALANRPNVNVRVVEGAALTALLGNDGNDGNDGNGRPSLNRVLATALRVARRGNAFAHAHASDLRARAAGSQRYVIYTAPDQAPIARWLGRRRGIYYVVDDFTIGHDYWSEALVQKWEERLVEACDSTVAVSHALAAKLEKRLGLPRHSVHVSPNAVPADAVPDRLPAHPASLETVGIPLERPVIGILGTISSRLRLAWLRHAVDCLPDLRWLFAGSIEDVELVAEDREHLDWLRVHPRCHFSGSMSYRQLIACAASIDVALLPYSTRSVNPCGSSMRFFMHLAFGQPILVTPGCAQLDEFADLVTMCPSAESLVDELRNVVESRFDDGKRRLRWEAAQLHTFDRRAERIVGLLRGAA